MVTCERIEALAQILYCNAYEAEFGGKERGRFLVSREDLKQMLGVFRLHGSTLGKLIDACGDLGLVVIDMDGSFAFVEKAFVQKWRKLPSRLAHEYANEIRQDDEESELDDHDEADDDD